MPALFAKLPESGPSRRRSPAGAAVSVLLHATLITLAVVATAKAGPGAAPRPDERTIIWRPPQPPPPLTDGETRRGGPPAGPRRSDQPESPTPRPPFPVPPIDPGIPVPPAPGGPITEPWDRGSGTVYSGQGEASGLSHDTDGVFTGPQVERPAALRGTVSPRYPSMLRERGVEGSATLRFVVDTTGRVEPTSVVVVASTHDLFAAAARAALPSLRFTPAEAGGRRVRQLVELPFSFELR